MLWSTEKTVQNLPPNKFIRDKDLETTENLYVPLFQ